MPNTPQSLHTQGLKKLAAQIVSQLPDDKKDALTVLAIAQEFVRWEYEGVPLAAAILKIVG